MELKYPEPPDSGQRPPIVRLANCFQQVGRTATAWTTFLRAAEASGAAGNVEREAEARARAAALEPHLSRLEVRVPSKLPGLVLQQDGVPLDPSQWNQARPVDPGEHSLEASAPGYSPWRTTVNVVTGDSPTSLVRVPEALGGPLGAPGAISSSSAAASSPVPIAGSGARVGSAHSLSSRQIGALAAGGIGLIGLVVGSAFGLRSRAKHNESDRYCSGPGPSCWDIRGVDAINSAQSAGAISTAAFVMGGVGIASGAALWLTTQRANRTPGIGRESAAINMDYGIGLGAVEVWGRW